MVDLKLSTVFLDAGRLQLGDITTAEQWGTFRETFTKFLVTIAYGDGPGWTYETSPALDGPLATGELTITAGALLASLEGSAYILNNQAVFRSGALYVTVRAVSEQLVNRFLSNYTVRLPSVLPDKTYVWVLRESEWVNITELGKVVNGAWQYQVRDSLDLYTNWKVIYGGVEVLTGMVLVEQISTSANAKTIQAVVGKGDVLLFVSATERITWSELVAVWLRDQITEASQSRSYKAHLGIATPDMGRLAFIGQLLDRLDIAGSRLGSAVLDLSTGQLLLKRVQAELRAWKR